MINKQSGFTLIELLIAVSILSALLFTGTYSYQMLAGRWQKELGQFSQSTKSVKHINLLNTVLSGVQPYVLENKQFNFSKPAFFFIGFEQSLLSITRSGLFSKGYPEIFRLSALEKENGRFDLIYQAVSSEKLLLLSVQQNIDFQYSIKLLEDVDKINFNYLGWNSYMELAEAATTLKPATWRKNFSGIDNQLLPLEMSIALKKNDRELDFSVSFDRKTLRYLTPYIDIDKKPENE